MVRDEAIIRKLLETLDTLIYQMLITEQIPLSVPPVDIVAVLKWVLQRTSEFEIDLGNYIVSVQGDDIFVNER